MFLVSVFIEEPSSVVVAENDVAVVRCRINSGVQGWTVDGEELNKQTPQNYPDFQIQTVDASSGPPVHTLSIVGRSAYNGTTVLCSSLSYGGSFNSSHATLQIQGEHVHDMHDITHGTIVGNVAVFTNSDTCTPCTVAPGHVLLPLQVC